MPSHSRLWIIFGFGLALSLPPIGPAQAVYYIRKPTAGAPVVTPLPQKVTPIPAPVVQPAPMQVAPYAVKPVIVQAAPLPVTPPAQQTCTQNDLNFLRGLQAAFPTEPVEIPAAARTTRNMQEAREREAVQELQVKGLSDFLNSPGNLEKVALLNLKCADAMATASTPQVQTRKKNY